MEEEITERDLRIRAEYIAKAESAESFKDAVFFIHYYNREIKRWGPRPKPNDISPSEVFESIDEEEYENTLKIVTDLLSRTAYVGAAFHRYEGASSYEEALERMRTEYPGFSDEAYSKVSGKSATAMR